MLHVNFSMFLASEATKRACCYEKEKKIRSLKRLHTMENGFIVDELLNLIKIFSMCASVRTEGTITVVDLTYSS